MKCYYYNTQKGLLLDFFDGVVIVSRTPLHTPVKRIADLATNSMNICAKVILKVIPFGDNVKQLRAKKIIEEKAADKTMKNKMRRLVELIPIKKSLLLAQKQLNDRNIDSIMMEFATIGLSPVCISKRQEIDYLENIYSFL